jgi:hypothetical protein
VLAIEVKTNVLERAMRYPLSERSQMRACRTPAGSATENVLRGQRLGKRRCAIPASRVERCS